MKPVHLAYIERPLLCSPGELEYGQAKRSATLVLQIFIFIWHRHPTTSFCWMLNQQARNAAIFVIADSWQTANYESIQLVDDTLAILSELQRNSIEYSSCVTVKLLSDSLSRLGARWQEQHAKPSTSI